VFSIFSTGPKTLSQLIARAKDGDTLSLDDAADSETSPIVVRKSVTLVAITRRRLHQALIIEGNCHVRFMGVDFAKPLLGRQASKLTIEGGTFSSVDYSDQLAVVEPDPRSKWRSTIRLEGRGTFCELADVSFHGETIAVLLLNGAEAMIHGCSFQALKSPAIWLGGGSGTKIDVNRSTFKDLRSNGVIATEGAHASITECSFELIDKVAVLLGKAGTKIDVNRSTFKDLRGTGVFAGEGAHASIAECSFELIDRTAVLLGKAGTKIDVNRSTFKDLRGTGVFAGEGAHASIAECSFELIDRTAVLLGKAGTKIDVNRSTFKDLRGTGVFAGEGAHASIAECSFELIDRTAVLLGKAGTKIDVNRSTFKDLRGNGVKATEGAHASITECSFELIDQPAVLLDNAGTKIDVNRSTFKDLRGNGVKATEGAHASITECSFELIDQPAVLLDNAGTKIDVNRSTFKDLRSNGVVAHEGAQAKVIDCTFERIRTVGQDAPAVVARGADTRVGVERSRFSDSNSGFILARDKAQTIFEGCSFNNSGTPCIEVMEGARCEGVSSTFLELRGVAVRARDARAVFKRTRFDRLFGGAVTSEGAKARIEILDSSFSEIAGTTGTVLKGSQVALTNCSHDAIAVWQIDEQSRAYEDGARLPSAMPSAESPFIEDLPRTSTPASPPESAALQRLDKLTGLAGVKIEVRTLSALAEAEQRRKQQGHKGSDLTLHLVFAGNPGTGKTTVARIVGDIFRDLGLLKRGHVVEVDRSGLVGAFIGHTEQNTRKKIDEALDGILFVDEAYALWKPESANDFGQEAITTILKAMEDHRGRLVVIVAGYSNEMRRFVNANPGLKSRFTRTIHFEDYSASELITMFQAIAAAQGMQITSEAKNALDATIQEMVRTKDENFGNGRDIRMLYQRTIERQGLRLKSFSAADISLIEASDIPPISEGRRANLERLLAKLNGMIGLSNVKAEIKRLVNVALANEKRAEKNLPPLPVSLHMVFTGNPGTGKTTVARLLGQIFLSLGLLKTGHMVEADRGRLVAGQQGQTAIKTSEAIKDALGGVLFIDEAYTLAKPQNSQDFGQEAIDTLLKEMEDKRDRLAVVVAGYTNEMKRFITSNPGLESRFTRYVHFDDYAADELATIFSYFAAEHGLTVSEDARTAVFKACEQMYADRSNGFGNGRSVRKLFERTLENQAARLVSEDSDDLTIIAALDVSG